jgi:hypothetical protein
MHTAAAYLRMRLGRRGQGGTVGCAQPIEAAHLLTASPSRVSSNNITTTLKSNPLLQHSTLHAYSLSQATRTPRTRSLVVWLIESRCLSFDPSVHYLFSHHKVHERLLASSEPSDDDHGPITHASSRITRSRLPTLLFHDGPSTEALGSMQTADRRACDISPQSS